MTKKYIESSPTDLINLIAITGKKQSGKGVVAKILVENYGYTEIAFADALRGMLSVLNPLVSVIDGQHIRYNDAMEMFSYTRAKYVFPELRRLMQVFGTNIMREMIDTEIWVKFLEQGILPGQKYVISDLRFPNEEEFVRKKGGTVVKVIRERGDIGKLLKDELSRHKSETEIEKVEPDIVIYNNGTLEELEATVHSTLIPYIRSRDSGRVKE